MSARILLLISLAMLLTLAAPAVGQQTPGELLQSALYKQQVEGDLQGAVTILEGLIEDFGQHREIAARALVQLGLAHETLGSTDAQRAYQRIVSDYPDQQEQVVVARSRLAALVRPAAPTNPSGVVVRQVWTGPDVDVTGGPSLDGRYLSYVDWETGDLAIRDLFTGEKRRLTSRAPGEFAFYSRISPDGQHVAYVWVDQENPYHLRVTSINDLRNGVEPRVLVRNTGGYMEFGDWSPDGQSLLANIRGIDLISVSDGTMTTLKTLNWGRPQPRFSPDGRWIVYHVRPQQDSPDRDIFVLAADGSRETPLVEHPGDDFVLGWAPDGKRILFASNRSGVLSAWVIAVEDGKPRGAPELVKPDIGNIVPMGFTRTGAFYYGTSTGMSDVYTATLDPATGRGVTPPAPVSPQFQGRGSSPAWSPDGEFVAYLSNRRAAANVARGPRVICIRSLKTGEEREVSTPLSFQIASRLHWSPDGRFLLATAFLRGRGGLYRIDVQSGEVAPIVQGSSVAFRPHGVWSLDGKAIFYSYRPAESQTPLVATAIRRRDVETGRETEIYRSATSEPGPNNLALSPDGRWLAFGLGYGVDSGVLMVMPAAGGEPRELMRSPWSEQWDTFATPFTGLEWAGDGRHLLFSGAGAGASAEYESELWRISVEGGEPHKVGLITQRRGTLAIHPDGRQIAFTAGETKREVWVMENLLPPLQAAR